MATKVAALLCIALSFPALGSEPRHPYSGVEYLKNYALSACISDAYQAPEVVKDANAAASGYLELGTFPIEAHQEAIALAQAFLKREYFSRSGERLMLMKCIDFYHSKELDQLVRRYKRNK